MKKLLVVILILAISLTSFAGFKGFSGSKSFGKSFSSSKSFGKSYNSNSFSSSKKSSGGFFSKTPSTKSKSNVSSNFSTGKIGTSSKNYQKFDSKVFSVFSTNKTSGAKFSGVNKNNFFNNFNNRTYRNNVSSYLGVGYYHPYTYLMPHWYAIGAISAAHAVSDAVLFSMATREISSAFARSAFGIGYNPFFMSNYRMAFDGVYFDYNNARYRATFGTNGWVFKRTIGNLFLHGVQTFFTVVLILLIVFAFVAFMVMRKRRYHYYSRAR